MDYGFPTTVDWLSGLTDFVMLLAGKRIFVKSLPSSEQQGDGPNGTTPSVVALKQLEELGLQVEEDETESKTN